MVSSGIGWKAGGREEVETAMAGTGVAMGDELHFTERPAARSVPVHTETAV
jgi:hypothetical protein